MKKKTLSYALILISIIVAAFTSCSGETQTPAEEQGYIRFNSDYNSESELTWYYTASKLDSCGTTGASDNEIKIGGADETGLDEVIGPFSEGEWEFVLTGYDVGESTVQMFKGTSGAVVVSGNDTADNPLIVTVSSSSMESTGQIMLRDAYWNASSSGIADIPFVKFTLRNDDTSAVSNAISSFKLSSGSENSVFFNDQIISFDTADGNVEAGDYTLVVEVFSNSSEDVRAVYEQRITVKSETITVISGDISDIEFHEIGFDDEVLDSSEIINDIDDNSPVIKIDITPSGDVSKMTEIDLSAVLTSGSEYSLNVEVIAKNDAYEDFKIIESGNGIEAVAGLDLSLNLLESGEHGITSEPVTDFGSSTVKVTTYVAPGLGEISDLSLAYVDESRKIVESEEVASQGHVYHKIAAYDNETGKIEISTNHFSSFYLTVSSDADKYGFASGSGTRGNPYIIETPEQFNSISSFSDKVRMAWNKDSYFWFDIMADLDFSGTTYEYIPFFRGEIDFNNHILSGLSEKNAEYGFIIDTIIEGAIRNLVYQPDDAIPLIYCVTWNSSNHLVKDGASIVLENIQVGSSDDIKTFEFGNNKSMFALMVLGENTHFTMKDCKNYYNGLSLEYSGVFLGGYAKNGAVLKFINCDNYGDFYGPKLSYLMGNDNNSGIASVSAEDCDNFGTLCASEQIHFVCFDHAGDYETNEAVIAYKDLGGNDEGTIKLLGSIDVEAAVSDDNQITISEIKTSEVYSKFEVVASGYAKMLDDGADAGTMLIRVSSGKKDAASLSDFAFGKYSFIDSTLTSIDQVQYENGNPVVEKNGEKYYVIDFSSYNTNGLKLEFTDNGILRDLKYTLYVYKEIGGYDALFGSYMIAD